MLVTTCCQRHGHCSSYKVAAFEAAVASELSLPLVAHVFFGCLRNLRGLLGSWFPWSLLRGERRVASSLERCLRPWLRAACLGPRYGSVLKARLEGQESLRDASCQLVTGGNEKPILTKLARGKLKC